MKTDFEELNARYDRLNSLYRVSQLLHSTLDAQKALGLILSEGLRLTGASSGSVVLINPTNGFLEILESRGLPSGATQLKLRPGEGITGWVARNGKAARVGEVSQDHRYIMVRPDVKSELAVPLEVNGELRGVLNVDSERQNAFTAEDQELLEDLAMEAAGVIHNTWLYEQLRLKAGLFESLAGVSQVINSALNLDDALMLITRESCELMQGRMCSLMLLDDSWQWLDLRASYGAGEAYKNKPRVNVAESALGAVVRRKKPLQIQNVQTSSRYQSVEAARKEGLVSLLSVPLLFADRAIGALNIYTGHQYSFSNEEIRSLSALAGLSAIAIEKARLYERVVDMEEQLRQNEKLSALGLLAAEVAHEIRNPLTVMKMLYHSLDLKFPENDPREKDARIIGDKMELLNRIVEQILDFARTTEPQLAPVDLNQLIDELGLLVRHKLKNQNIQLVRHLRDDMPPVMAEATQLEQAFLNLLLNAAEAMPKGGTLTISSRMISDSEASEANGYVAVDFSDTGEGMSEEQRRGAFSSVLSTTKRRGTGLGLAIVARVIETHRGKVKIASRVGHGTTVTVLLPRCDAVPETAESLES
jgi:signal transduction histidine kinase